MAWTLLVWIGLACSGPRLFVPVYGGPPRTTTFGFSMDNGYSFLNPFHYGQRKVFNLPSSFVLGFGAGTFDSRALEQME